MKQYFAKYLPVGGEIKEGDIVKDFSRPTYPVPYNPIHHKLEGKTKLKLFLCSRDIQVGDECFFTEDVTASSVVAASEVTLDFLRRKAFKILGEISLEAKWVKDGDEFNREEWMCNWAKNNCNCKEHNHISTSGIIFHKAPTWMNHNILIKCLCCETFK